MNTSFLHFIKNYIYKSQPSKTTRWLLMAIFVLNLFFVSTVFAQNGPNCSSGICLGPGGSLSNSNLTVSTNTFYASITVNNGKTLTVKSGVTLYVGQVGTAANTQVVDFQNGCFVIIESGASLVVNGLLNNSNNSNGVTIDGSVSVTGNVTAGNGSTIVGTGTIDTSGTITTDGSGSIFGSTGECSAGPCSGSQLNCSGQTNIISGNQTICSGSTPTTLIGSTIISPATYQWQNSLTSGANFSDILGATAPNYSPGSLVTTTYYRRKQTVGGCIGTSNQVVVTVNTVSTIVLTSGTQSPTVCPETAITNTVYTFGGSATGATVSGLPAGLSQIVNGSTITISGTPTASGTYTISTTGHTAPCVAASISGTVSINTTNTWIGAPNTSWFTATNWSCGSVPTAASDVVIPTGKTPIIDDVTKIALANTVTVASGSSLTVNNGNTLKLTDKLTNNGGTITFEDSASLVQTNNVATNTNTGNIIYKRETGVRNTDYTFWSSPVSPLKLAGVGGISYSPASLAGSIFYSYLVTASSENWQSETETTTMIPGIGYSIRAAGAISSNPPSLLETSFTGVPNNGTISVAIAKAGASYLLGNPYPSALDADEFLIANKDVINGTLYFWTHNTPIAVGTPDPGSGIWAYSGNDYAAYNATGGVAAINPPDIDPVTGQPYPAQAPTGGAVPSGKIASGQGFFGSSKGSLPTNPKIVYDNTMRVGVGGISGNNSQFFKIKNTKVTSPIEKHRIWLDLTNVEGAFKQTLVGYVTGATNDYDDRFDGESYDGNDFLDFYSINDEKNLTIQGRTLPFNENDEVPLGYRVALGGTFTMKVGQKDGLLSNQDVFIEDKLTNTVTNLKSGNYTFKTAAGTFNDRFVLRYTNKTLGTTDFDVKEKSVLVSIKNKQIKINSFGEIIGKVTIFDLLGRQIYHKDKINSNELVLADFRANHETLIVKTSLQNGKVVSEKIIF